MAVALHAGAAQVAIASPITEPGEHSIVLKVGDLDRRYVVHVPKAYAGKRAVPVVIMFHGGGGTARDAIRQTAWSDKADAAGFLAVYPEGLSRDPAKPGHFRNNPQTWNDASGRFYPESVGVDDGAFARAILDDLGARFNIDARRVYLTGFSNGSSLVYRIGVELSDRVAAIAPVGSSGLRLPDPLTLKRPVSLIAIQGGADRLNPLEGGDVVGIGRGDPDPRPPIKVTIERWARMLQCPREPAARATRDGIRTLRYSPCMEGSEVLYTVIADMGHTWPGGLSLLPQWLVGKNTDKLNATDVIWDFFEKHPLPERN